MTVSGSNMHTACLTIFIGYHSLLGFSSLLSGSLALEALPIGVHCKKRYIIDTIRYRTKCKNYSLMSSTGLNVGEAGSFVTSRLYSKD